MRSAPHHASQDESAGGARTCCCCQLRWPIWLRKNCALIGLGVEAASHPSKALRLQRLVY